MKKKVGAVKWEIEPKTLHAHSMRWQNQSAHLSIFCEREHNNVHRVKDREREPVSERLSRTEMKDKFNATKLKLQLTTAEVESTLLRAAFTRNRNEEKKNDFFIHFDMRNSIHTDSSM